MDNFSIKILTEKDGKIVTLNTDDMQIHIYQRKNDKMVRVFNIECDRPGGHPLGTLRTTSEFVGRDNDEKVSVTYYKFGKRVKAISNKYVGDE